jgi:predicted small lipoprotein YifL
MREQLLPVAASLCILLLSAIAGCGTDSPSTTPDQSAEKTPSVQVEKAKSPADTTESLAGKTEAILSLLGEADYALSTKQLMLLRLRRLRMQAGAFDGPDATREEAAMVLVKEAQAEANSIREAIYSHSEYKTPRLDEIRHDEIDHAALRERLGVLLQKIKAAEEASREKR